jgi:hypothetical protein
VNCEAVQAVLQHSRATNAARMVMVALAARADVKGIVRNLPIPELVKDANATDRTVKAALRELRKLGELATDRPDKGRGHFYDYDISAFLGKVKKASDIGEESTPLPENGETSTPFVAGKGEDISTKGEESTPIESGKGEDFSGTAVASYKAETDQEEDLKDTKSHPEAGASAVSPVLKIFDHWREVMKHPQAKLTPERGRAIRGRLKDGYTVAEICAAVDGCRASPFHMGENESRKVHDDLTLICRNGSKLESFMALAETGGTRPQNGSAAPKPELNAEQIESVTRTVLDRLQDGEAIEDIERQIAPSLTPYDWLKVKSMALAQVGPDKQPKPPPVSPGRAVVTEIASRMRMPHG